MSEVRDFSSSALPLDEPLFSFYFVFCISNLAFFMFRYETAGEDDFSQAKLFWKNVLKPDERTRLVNNLVNNLKSAVEFIQV